MWLHCLLHLDACGMTKPQCLSRPTDCKLLTPRSRVLPANNAEKYKGQRQKQVEAGRPRADGLHHLPKDVQRGANEV